MIVNTDRAGRPWRERSAGLEKIFELEIDTTSDDLFNLQLILSWMTKYIGFYIGDSIKGHT